MRSFNALAFGLMTALCPVAWLAMAPAAASAHTAPPAYAHVLKVGIGKAFATPQQAYAAAVPGDLILIYADHVYRDNAAKLVIRGKDRVTFRGVSVPGKTRRAIMQLSSGVRPALGKGIWVVHANDTVIENIDFGGARLNDDKNGAGIRVDPVRNISIRDCYFHDNDNGILTAPSPASHVLIENSEFARNGHGDGYSHNTYVADSILTFRYNYSHSVNNGNLLKTRAHLNFIEYNRIAYGTNSRYTANYVIDIPDGGVAYVIGNVIEQAAYLNTRKYNSTMVSYGAEHRTRYAKNALYVVNNTFVNNAGSGRFISVPRNPSLTVVNRNNIFTGAGTVQDGAAHWRSDHNYRGDPGYLAPGNLDYRLKSATSPAVDAGAAPGKARGYDLTPRHEFVLPNLDKPRKRAGRGLDIGAFEYAH